MTKTSGAKTKARSAAAKPVKKTAAQAEVPQPELDPAVYNEFIRSLKLLNINLAELGARCLQRDLEGQEVNIKSNFSVSCVNQDEQSFTAEARLHLTFESENTSELGSVLCAYHLQYEADVELTDAIFNEFSRRNVPLNAWPFLRELVMATTQRFGWSGLILPPFKVPAVNRAAGSTQTPKTPRRKSASKS